MAQRLDGARDMNGFRAKPIQVPSDWFVEMLRLMDAQYKQTVTYNPQNDTIRLALSGKSEEYERGSYAEFYAYREFLAK